jgi:hypothetical protein
MKIDTKSEDQNELTLEGFWWLPANPDRRLPGKLTFSSHAGGTLEVWDELCRCGLRTQPANCHETIHGLTSTAQPISLYDCTIQGKDTHNRRHARVVTTCYHTGFLLRGAHFKSPDEATFSSYIAEFPNLAAWLGGEAASTEWAKDVTGVVNELVVKWPVPAKMTLYANPQYQINVYTQTRTDPSGQSALRISQRHLLELEFPNSSSIKDMWPILRRIRDLLSLGFGDPAYAISLAALHKAPDSRFPHTVGLYRWNDDNRGAKNLSAFRMLFTHLELQTKAPDGFKKWLASDAKGINALRPFFAVLYNDELYLETKFTLLVNALESYHRRTGQNQVCANEEHQARLKRIREVIRDDTDRNWLDARLSKSNQPALRARLTELASRIPSVTKKIEQNCTNFIAQVTDTRNYLVHYDSSLEQKAATGEELIRLTHRVEAFCAALLLLELGFPENVLPHMLSRTDRYP